MHAAIDANCLSAQNNDAYWDYADYLHANQRAVGSERGRDGQNAELDKLAACRLRNIISTFRSCRHVSRLRMSKLCAPRCVKGKRWEWKRLPSSS